MLFDYDVNDLGSIFTYAKRLEGQTFQNIEDQYEASLRKGYFDDDPKDKGSSMVSDTELIYDNTSVAKIPSKKAKGQLGNLLETHYFGYDANGNQQADFVSVGVELKATPIDLTKKGGMRAGERLSITNISYTEPVIENFYNSHVWEKIHKILLIQYLRDRTKDRMDYIIKFVNMFTPPANDLKIIEADYEYINNKLKDGLAHELSEGDTMYLGACTKGSTAERSWRPQYYGEHIQAKKRNYCLKQSYMNYVLNEYVLKGKVPFDGVLHNIGSEDSLLSEKELENKRFEEILIGRIDRYKGKSDEELCKVFDRPYNNNKAQWSDLSYRMLGLKSNHAEELTKAGIKVKSIRIEANGSIKESMPLPAFEFRKFAEEDWDNSELYNYLENQKYFFVVYKKIGSKYHLVGAQLWNMPQKDIEEKVRPGWQQIHDKLIDGICFTKKRDKNGKLIIANDLPKKTNNDIIHIRPHAPKAAYRLDDGTVIGDMKDADELPDGQWMTKQSMWINNDYILSQLKVK